MVQSKVKPLFKPKSFCLLSRMITLLVIIWWDVWRWFENFRNIYFDFIILQTYWCDNWLHVEWRCLWCRRYVVIISHYLTWFTLMLRKNTANTFFLNILVHKIVQDSDLSPILPVIFDCELKVSRQINLFPRVYKYLLNSSTFLMLQP